MHLARVCILMHVVITTPIRCAIFTPEQEQRITEFVETLMDCKHNPGLTLAVVKGSNTWAKGFGLADLDTKRAVQNDTMFMIASLGKAFTMALLGNLLEGTSYNWSTKVADIEGVNLQFINENLTREVTLADLLAHRTGLSDILEYGAIAGYPKGTTVEYLSSLRIDGVFYMVLRLWVGERRGGPEPLFSNLLPAYEAHQAGLQQLKYVPEKFGLREPNFLYNNGMYLILGHVIEVLGKDTWTNLMTSHILEPLGMTTSKVMSRADDVFTGNVAKPYIMPGDAYLLGSSDQYTITPLEPAGGMLSSAVDMATWIRFNLDYGRTKNGQQLVNEQLLAEAFQKQRGIPYYSSLLDHTNPPFPVDSLYNGCGYGWFTSTYRGFRRVGHSGGYFSYVSQLWMFPEQDFGLFVNVNGPGLPDASGKTVNVALFYLADILLGVEPWLNVSTACTFPAPWKPSGDDLEIPPTPVFQNENLREYVGLYGSSVLPDIAVELSEDASKLRFQQSRVKGILDPTAEPDSFQFKVTEPWEFAIEKKVTETFMIKFPVQFYRDSEGIVQNLTLTLDIAVMPFRKGMRFPDVDNTSSGTEVHAAVSFLVMSLFLRVYGHIL